MSGPMTPVCLLRGTVHRVMRPMQVCDVAQIADAESSRSRDHPSPPPDSRSRNRQVQGHAGETTRTTTLQCWPSLIRLCPGRTSERPLPTTSVAARRALFKPPTPRRQHMDELDLGPAIQEAENPGLAACLVGCHGPPSTGRGPHAARQTPIPRLTVICDGESCMMHTDR